ncbi:MAG: response regulator transcription factor [Sphingomonas sp.]|uniref:response regulator transcription factor n=1 Tax=unclassified Sphingomonas TaxID=196159 RepID=UPI002455BAB4|nr:MULTISPECIES: response regulator transcription factor [unclassified Sphingomonas]MBQ1499754.1 response regulator transcription factor [Sphingomonas sp.]MDH4746280.1 response regulator transcription factor [Sphingomonas sp. CBMAI 2297]
MARLLLIEDDAPLGRGMRAALEDAGHAVDWARTGEEALLACRSEAYGVVLLDLGLPDVSGLEVLRELRSENRLVPVIVITAQDRITQRIAGLDAGADDYLVKPLDIDELTARVRAQLRRRDGRGSDLLVVRDVALDLGGRTVRLRDQPVALTAKEFRIAALLMRRAGRFVSKAELEAALYDQDQYIESNTVEVAISALRRKLERDFIVTARGLGYMVAK